MTKVALTIAASDSISGAGAQVDLHVLRDFDVYGVCAITSITAQNTLGVQKIKTLPPSTIVAQIDSVTRDLNVSACKIGMLYNHQTVEIVVDRIKRRSIPNIVLDPVISAKGGETLLKEKAVKKLKRYLIPLVSLVTPNISEANILTGTEVTSKIEAREAAKMLFDMGAKNVLIKGGHFSCEPIDVFYNGTDFIDFSGKRLDKNMHGTGCVLSSAITAGLAQGNDLPQAIANAKDYVSKAIESSLKLGKGNMDLFFKLKDSGG